MLPRRRKAPKMNVSERGPLRCIPHLQFVRGFECCASGHGNCAGKIEAMHVRCGTDGRMGEKPGDNFSIPGCSAHHREQHQIGEKTFAAKYGIDLLAIANKLWQISPHRRKAEAME